MTLKSIASLTLVLLLTFGCSQKEDEELPEKVTFGDIINVIYDGISSRLENRGSYKPFNGAVSATFEGADMEGTFTLSYSKFSEPSFCSFGQDCVCTGLLKGKFKVVEDPSANGEEVNEPDQTPYNPNDPITEPETEDANPDISTTVVFLDIKIDYQATSLSSGCPNQIDRMMKITISNDRRVVLSDLGKELLLVPRLR